MRDKADDSSLNKLNDITNAVKSLRQLEENSQLKTEIQFVQENCTDHVLHVEQKYIERDGIFTTLEPFIINVTSDRDSSSESEEPIEFLESDFDYDT